MLASFRAESYILHIKATPMCKSDIELQCNCIVQNVKNVQSYSLNL